MKSLQFSHHKPQQMSLATVKVTLAAIGAAMGAAVPVSAQSLITNGVLLVTPPTNSHIAKSISSFSSPPFINISDGTQTVTSTWTFDWVPPLILPPVDLTSETVTLAGSGNITGTVSDPAHAKASAAIGAAGLSTSPDFDRAIVSSTSYDFYGGSPWTMTFTVKLVAASSITPPTDPAPDVESPAKITASASATADVTGSAEQHRIIVASLQGDSHTGLVVTASALPIKASDRKSNHRAKMRLSNRTTLKKQSTRG